MHVSVRQLNGKLDEVIRIPREKAGSYQSYVLHYRQEQTNASSQPPGNRFVLQEASGAQHQQGFGSFEQVMNYLLDELLGPQ